MEVTETYESRHKSEMPKGERRVPGPKGAGAEKERNDRKASYMYEKHCASTETKPSNLPQVAPDPAIVPYIHPTRALLQPQLRG